MRTIFLASLVLATIAIAGCHSESSTPTEPGAPYGQLKFEDSGCACSKPPYPPINVFVDGQKAGELPVFGELKVTATTGNHVYSTDDGVPPTLVTVKGGGVTTINLYTNVDCTGGCPVDPTDP